jgi:micrococcal nuclease
MKGVTLRKWIFLIGLTAVALSRLLPDAGGTDPLPAGAPAERTGRVVFVADGDTLRASIGGESEWVRFLRIDTPEKGEKGYRQAREALIDLVDGEEVTLVFEEEGVPERDDYGRLLAYVFFEGKNVNVEMVRLGWSPFWTRYGKGRFAREFREAEASARRGGRGNWGPGGKVPGPEDGR